MKALGREADRPAQVYLTGGATAVLYGWRESTIDVDMKMVPDLDRVFRAIPEIKERLQINIELASPDDFIPVREGWEDRSPFITQIPSSNAFPNPNCPIPVTFGRWRLGVSWDLVPGAWDLVLCK